MPAGHAISAESFELLSPGDADVEVVSRFGVVSVWWDVSLGSASAVARRGSRSIAWTSARPPQAKTKTPKNTGNRIESAR
jgi:hypothetical protein